MAGYNLQQIHEMHIEATARNDGKALEKCENLYTQILNQKPDNWTTMFLMAGLYMQSDRNGLAINLLKRVLDMKPDMPEAWNNLGTAYRRQFMEDEATQALKRCVELKPEDPDAWNNLGTLHINEGTPEEGIPLFLKALSLNPDHVHAHWNLALAYLESGQYEEGFYHYKWGLISHDRLKRTYACPEWDYKPNPGTVVVYGEQGIGDEIMFASMVPDLKQDVGKVIFDCHPRLVGLFERSFGIECHGTRKETVTPWAAEHDIAASVSAAGLGIPYRKEVDDFPGTPYLVADPERVEKMMTRLAELPSGLNVGISWKGGKHKTRTDMRTTGLERLVPILQTEGVNFISLQYTPAAQHDIDEVKKRHEFTLHHWPEIVQAEDYDETAALVEALDLVISVNTSVVHLSGALGKECWTMTPVRKAWRYYSPDGKFGEQMVWYNSVKQYQQTTDGEWGAVIENVAADLRDLVAEPQLIMESGT